MKRYFIKYIRDGAKAAYDKGTECFICGSTEQLDFHHFCSLAELANSWVRKNKLIIETADDALKWRDVFIEEHQTELYDEAVTLCHEHHQQLHSIYGKNPKLITAPKQARWVQRQRDKKYGVVE
jgi:5-methylcytosine-specific restriction endonuclease McrA